MACNFLRDCCEELQICFKEWCCCCCYRPCKDSDENGHLLPNLTSVIAPCKKPETAEMCRIVWESFSHEYLKSKRQKIMWDTSTTINSQTIIICPKISRLEDDIKNTLDCLRTGESNPKILLIIIHSCGSDISPENLLTQLPDKRVTSFTNILYSESRNPICYDCEINRKAANSIKKFI